MGWEGLGSVQNLLKCSALNGRIGQIHGKRVAGRDLVDLARLANSARSCCGVLPVGNEWVMEVKGGQARGSFLILPGHNCSSDLFQLHQMTRENKKSELQYEMTPAVLLELASSW